MTAVPYERFMNGKNKLFHVTHDEKEPPLPMELVEISPIKAVGGGYGSFSLMFQAAKDKGLLGQGTWTLTDDERNSIDLFLVPVGELEDHYQYESVFSFRK